MRKKNVLIVILSGGLVKIGRKWRTTTFFERDFSQGLGDRYRILAASELYGKLSDEGRIPDLLASGGAGKGVIKYPYHPVIADIMSAELIKLGIPKKSILKDRNTNSTFEQLLHIKKLFSLKKTGSVIIISNKYHIPRIRAMIVHSPKLHILRRKLSDGFLKIISAESILLKADFPRWNKEIKRAYKSDFVIRRMRMEKRGIRQILNKTYQW